MKNKKNLALAGYLFLLSGLMFMFAAWNGEQTTFGALSVMFIILGIVFIKQSKDAPPEE